MALPKTCAQKSSVVDQRGKSLLELPTAPLLLGRTSVVLIEFNIRPGKRPDLETSEADLSKLRLFGPEADEGGAVRNIDEVDS